MTYADGIVKASKHYAESPLARVSRIGSADRKKRIDLNMLNRIALRLTFKKTQRPTQDPGRLSRH
jgi:hypothetical protein